MSVHSLQQLAKNISNNRWLNEFTEGEKIGKGGFASVYKAKNHFDENNYAVKKIKIRVNNLKENVQEELERALTESKFLARVNHHNVLRYYNSWLEVGTKLKELAKPKAPQQGKNKGEWREIGTEDDEQESEDISTYDSFGDLDSSAVVFDRSSEYESEDNHFIFEDNSQSTEQNSMMKSLEKKNVKKELTQTLDPVLEALSSGLSEDETIERIELFIQTELCKESLGDYIALRNRKLASLQTKNPEGYKEAWKKYLKEAISFAKQILEGLTHIHSHGIIHRDLKPQNIFLSNNICKIGDFGLIKMNDSSKTEISTCIEAETCNDSQASPKAHAPSKHQSKSKEALGAVGTRVFASPEQWEGDNENLDFKADVFSLGITLLLLFHPMSTSMEELQVINDSRKGSLPTRLEKDLPEIAKIIKKMLSVDPYDRPSLEIVSSHLKFSVETNTEVCGMITLKREDSEAWNNNYFKLNGKNLYVFKSEQDKKAESVYVLPEWSVLLETHPSETCITLEDPMKLGCSIKMESCEQTINLYNQLSKYVS